MRTFVAIVIGIVIGVGVAVGLAVAAYSLVPSLPAPTAAPTAPPAVVVATPAPTAAPTATPAATPLASPSGSPSAFPLVGKVAPALTLPSVAGSSIDLAAYRGKAVWVVFTGTYCPPCRDEYPLMNGFSVRYAEAGLVVIAVHVKEDAATVKPFVENLNIGFPVGLDGDGSRAAAWDAVALPVHYWIDTAGVIRAAALGGLGPDQMAANLGTVLPGVTIGE